MVVLVYTLNSANIALDLGAFACKRGFPSARMAYAVVKHLQMPLHALQTLQKPVQLLLRGAHKVTICLFIQREKPSQRGR